MDKLTEKLLTKGVDHIYPSKEALAALFQSGKKLRVYFGIDPTGAMQLHHTVPLRKLRHFQELGHQVILLIGSFTAMIGDPTGKSKARVPLTKEQVLANARDYVDLAKRILDFENNAPEVVFNGDWLAKLTFEEVVKLASHFTVQQMMERDMFQDRVRQGLPISVHEFMYPLMQGYDSVATNCDVEVGGTDQTFNMLAGRHLVKAIQNREKFVLTTPLLTDDQGRKTSTSDGTGVPLSLAPADLYGKVMSLPDGLVVPIYSLCTDLNNDEISRIKDQLANGNNPMQIKKQLAFELVETFHGKDQAEQSQLKFESTVQRNELPEEIPVYQVGNEVTTLRELLVNSGLCESNAEAKRMVEEGAVALYTNGEEQRMENSKAEIQFEGEVVLRVGKRKYLKLRK